MIFIDTGAFIARYMANDQYHDLALLFWDSLKTEKCLTSNHVLDETFTLLGRWTNPSFAIEKARYLYSSSICIYRPSAEEEYLALQYFEKFADQQVSFTDCLSFAIMKKLKIQNVFSFDKHFILAGFRTLLHKENK